MYHSGIEAPQGVWWKPAHRSEKIWVSIAFAWCMVLFAMMPLWHLRGGQNPSGIRHRVEAEAYRARVTEFIQQYQVGTDRGMPVVAPPPGSDVYLQAQMWMWLPVLKLEEGAEYVLHLSSVDVNHGFSLFPLNLNFQVVPGYDYGLRVRPDQRLGAQVDPESGRRAGAHRRAHRIASAAARPAGGTTTSLPTIM